MAGSSRCSCGSVVVVMCSGSGCGELAVPVSCSHMARVVVLPSSTTLIVTPIIGAFGCGGVGTVSALMM